MVHIFGVRNFLVNGVGCPKLETEANVTQIPIYFENFSSASRILQTLQPGNKTICELALQYVVILFIVVADWSDCE